MERECWCLCGRATEKALDGVSMAVFSAGGLVDEDRREKRLRWEDAAGSSQERCRFENMTGLREDLGGQWRCHLEKQKSIG
jgi:hypothetical protein